MAYFVELTHIGTSSPSQSVCGCVSVCAHRVCALCVCAHIAGLSYLEVSFPPPSALIMQEV